MSKPAKLSEERLNFFVLHATGGTFPAAWANELIDHIACQFHELAAKDAEIERQAAEIRLLREALEPFAAQWMDPPNLPPLVQEDFRRAAKAMKGVG